MCLTGCGMNHVADGDEGNWESLVGGSAYISCDGAECRYEPEGESPVRLAPPYGEKVPILNLSGEWALIEFVGKKAWVLTEFLSTTEPQKRQRFLINRVPPPAPWYESIQDRTEDVVKFGPRGGRYIETKDGRKRYF